MTLFTNEPTFPGFFGDGDGDGDRLGDALDDGVGDGNSVGTGVGVAFKMAGAVPSPERIAKKANPASNNANSTTPT